MDTEQKFTQQSVLSNGDFLKRVETVKADILTLTANVSKIGTLHQSVLGDPYNNRSADLESLITQTQVLNTSIKDHIKFLETDAVRSRGNPVKDTQVKQLKSNFSRQLQDYRQEEATYERQYREQIKRQYEIVNPDATEAEKQEAAEADWGNEGVFQTALRTNRSATANTVLGAVRARHNDIQKIERTITELNQVSFRIPGRECCCMNCSFLPRYIRHVRLVLTVYCYSSWKTSLLLLW